MSEPALIHGLLFKRDSQGVERPVWPTSDDYPDLTTQPQSPEDIAAAIANTKRQLSQRGNKTIVVMPRRKR